MSTPETSCLPYVVNGVVPGRAQIVLRLESDIRLGGAPFEAMREGLSWVLGVGSKVVS